MTRAACILAAVLALAGCNHIGRDVIARQSPGSASGAGATLTGPANSAAPSTQHARKVTTYFPPASPLPAPARDAQQSPQVENFTPANTITAPAAPLAVASITEETQTTLGQHQDAAPLIKAAAAASSWSAVRWVGLLCVLVGLGGWLWSVGNPAGFPLVFLKIGGCGVALCLVGDNPLWLFLLALPLGFYAVQKLGLLRVP